MDILSKIKLGDKIMATQSSRGGGIKYSLSDGSEVSLDQFIAIRKFIAPCDLGLFPDGEPQTYAWDGAEKPTQEQLL